MPIAGKWFDFRFLKKGYTLHDDLIVVRLSQWFISFLFCLSKRPHRKHLDHEPNRSLIKGSMHF